MPKKSSAIFGNAIRQFGLILERLGPENGSGAESAVLGRFGDGDFMATDGNKHRPGQKGHIVADGKIVSVDGKVVSLGRDVQVKIGQHLRTMYDEVVKQGVPDHLNDLLQKLDRPRGKPDDKPGR
jgi:hypothetical protein